MVNGPLLSKNFTVASHSDIHIYPYPDDSSCQSKNVSKIFKLTAYNNVNIHNRSYLNAFCKTNIYKSSFCISCSAVVLKGQRLAKQCWQTATGWQLLMRSTSLPVNFSCRQRWLIHIYWQFIYITPFKYQHLSYQLLSKLHMNGYSSMLG